MKRRNVISVVTALAVFFPAGVFAASLDDVYATRPDLQAAFDAEGKPVGTAAGFLMNLEDWARQYGWREYAQLAEYAPMATVPTPITHPQSPLSLNSPISLVIDDASGAILAASGAERVWPIASITKLMTSTVAIDAGIDVGGTCSVKTIDDVGGAKLWVADGTTFTTRDVLAATLVGSANNAANALARSTGMADGEFVAEMNARAEEFGLTRTTFVDPTGIELGNVSTAREVAHFASKAFAREHIRRFAGSSHAVIAALNDASYVRDIKNTNWLLYDSAYDDLYVTAGKTGYLHESGWNLVVRLHPMGENEALRSLVIVTLGATGRRESFDDAAALARWTWKNFSW